MSEVFNRHGVQHNVYADDKQAYVDTPVFATFLQPVPNYKAAGLSLILVTGVPHVDYSVTKRNSSGLVDPWLSW